MIVSKIIRYKGNYIKNFEKISCGREEKRAEFLMEIENGSKIFIPYNLIPIIQ